MHLLRQFALLPRRLLQEVYWLFSGDAKTRSLGLETIGTVVAINERRKTAGGEFGGEYAYWEVSYTCETGGIAPARTEDCFSLNGLEVGDRVKVHYRTNIFPQPMVADWHRLSPCEADALESAARAVTERGTHVTRRVRGIREAGLSGLGHLAWGMVYEFRDERGRRWVNTKWTSEHPPYEVGSEVEVRYLPEQPEMNRVEN